MRLQALLSISIVTAACIGAVCSASAQSTPASLTLPRLDPEKILKKDMQILLTPRGWGAQISPDNKKIVFAYPYPGTNEIWISNLDGTNPVKVTSLDGSVVGVPRWSPDGNWIAFDVNGLNHGKIFVVSTKGRAPREVASDPAENVVPRWSQDGKWIYFASNRTGEWQVWKVTHQEGVPSQVTRQGGFAAAESPDGVYVYFSKSRYRKPEIWRVAMQGGSEEMVSSILRPDTWADWSVTPGGIYFTASTPDRKPKLLYFDFAAESVKEIAELRYPSFFLSVSHDGLLAICESPELDFPLVSSAVSKGQ